MKRIYFLLFLNIIALTASSQKLDMDKLKGMKPRSIGPAGMSGRITAIDVVVSNPDIIYAGTASGGLWKSTSAGINWEPLFDKESTLSIGAIAIQQDNPSVLWVGTGEGNPRNSLNSGNGVYLSLDAGKSWKKMGLENTHNIYRIVIDPKNTNTVYVGAIGSPWGEHPDRGVFKTIDGGATWKKILYVDEKTGCSELVMDPFNPNKLIAAMWQHRRWPWTFKSGGPGSGLHITYDGGNTWKKLSKKEGLPDGELGRVGVAIAPSNPNVIYALIEAKKNGLYKSTDGGEKWEMVNEKMNEIGDRPFYYSEIHADPLNENKIYTVYSEVNSSIDGGKSFQKLLPYSGVHPDHHSWWIHPTDPSLIIEGNDGGLNMSHDGGKSWRFAENIPVGQFYHVAVDNDFPYNVYGGLQDNGSWVGPAYTFQVGGILNSHWQEVMFGDGFDTQPDPTDSRYGYAMSQGGFLGRYDRKTGYTKMIKPTHPDSKMKLRFNWNSAFAQDPFDAATIYYASQFVHKSTDRGATWEIISPDLTTNDPEKQKQFESGGLTMDATGAENHCTILAISPSTKEKGVIWVGTDDGQLQLTRDGGKTWTNVTTKITGMPKNAWIPQVQASTYSGGEVFAVVNNYRQFDYKPYLFHSKDYGQTWESFVNGSQVGDNNYTLAVIQDPVEPKLIFLGTENGLFVSLDGAKTYTKWTAGYPAGTPTMDLVIHPREHDLVMGTFGRALWVLDDIRPLREMAKSGADLLNKKLHIFSPPDAYEVEYLSYSGTHFPAHAMFQGTNREFGAMISFVINKPEEKKEEKKEETKPADKKSDKKGTKPEEKKEDLPAGQPVKKDEKKPNYDSLKLEIFNSSGTKIRTIKQKAPEDNGLNRMYWGLDEKGVNNPSREKSKNTNERGGQQVPAGSYKLRLTFGDQKDSTLINVKYDPRFPNSGQNIEARYKLSKQLESMSEVVGKAMNQLRESKEIADEFEKKITDSKRADLKDALDKSKSIKDSIDSVFDYVLGKEDKRQGITSTKDPAPISYIGNAQFYIGSSKDPVSATDQRVFQQAQDHVSQIINRVNKFYEKTWKDYRSVLEKVSISPFKNYEILKLE